LTNGIVATVPDDANLVANSVVVKNCYYIGDGDITASTDGDDINNQQTSAWDDTYANETIGSISDGIPDGLELRWYNDDTDTNPWLIHDGSVDSGSAIIWDDSSFEIAQ
jgi:hypothetical protein